MKFQYEAVINRSRDEVWKLFDNPDNMKKWQPTLKKFEPQSGKPGQVGAVSKLTYEENGRAIVLIETISRRMSFRELIRIRWRPTRSKISLSRWMPIAPTG